MAGKPVAHPKHTDQEFVIAAITGVGLLLTILAGMFAAFGSRDELIGMNFTALFWAGMALIFVGLFLWLLGVQPWKQFDDLTTPYYTGHDDHHAEADHGDPHAAHAHEEVPAVTQAVEIDDLEIIEGIGSQAKAALVGAGITTFAQLADTDDATLEAITAPYKLLKPRTWKKQAQYVVNGDIHGFESYKKQLISGSIDDLEQIEGIGPKVKAALVAAGIRTFAQLSEAKVEDLRQILQTANLKLPKPDTWGRQAQYILNNDVEGFEAYKQKIRGGVEVD